MLDSADELFAWQHDPEAIGNDEYTFFDNESAGTPELPYSRAITVKLNEWKRTATLISSDNQPEDLSAASQGNAQTTGEGNLFVGWGALPYFSEFGPSGQLLFNAEFPAGVNTYRAYLLPWNPPGAGGSGPGGSGGLGGKGRPRVMDTAVMGTAAEVSWTWPAGITAILATTAAGSRWATPAPRTSTSLGAGRRHAPSRTPSGRPRPCGARASRSRRPGAQSPGTGPAPQPA